ncbi:MAG: hypothetical protein AAF513_05820 [Pseudomonadota bacterium]
MNPSILFLITTATEHNDNHLRLPQAFAARGWEAVVADHETLQWEHGTLRADGHDVAAADLIWTLGFGPLNTYADRAQMLGQLAPQRLVVPMQAWQQLHGKAAWLEAAPPTYIATHAEGLATHITAGSDWVLKPLGGSLGRDVIRVQDPDTVHTHIRSRPTGMWMLQAFVPEIAEGELRTLICGEEIVGTYRRIANQDAGEFRANLAQGARAEIASLNPGQASLVAATHQRLQQAGVRFAAIDIVGEYVMEVNLANPGGLSTLAGLYDSDPYQTVVEALGHCIAPTSTSVG